MIKEEFSLKLSTRSQAILELVLAGSLWGFGFVATVWALQTMSPTAVVFYRFMGAFLIGIFLLKLGRVPSVILRREAILSFLPGIILWIMLMLQTIGLKTTTATNSGFITTLYVIWVPLFRFLRHRERMGWVYWLSVATALLGTLFILNWHQLDLEHLNIGDLLTLLCSVMAAVHIIVVGQKAPLSKNDFAFNIFQSLWVALPCFLILPFSRQGWDLTGMNHLGWIGMISLTVGSSLIAFYLQVRAQKTLSPSTASLLFLLESPISCLFAVWLLNETLTPLKFFGALLIMLACTVISLPRKSR